MSDASIEEVTKLNIELSINRIRKESSILAEMEQLGEIEIVGALYSVATGKTTFFEG